MAKVTVSEEIGFLGGWLRFHGSSHPDLERSLTRLPPSDTLSHHFGLWEVTFVRFPITCFLQGETLFPTLNLLCTETRVSLHLPSHTLFMSIHPSTHSNCTLSSAHAPPS